MYEYFSRFGKIYKVLIPYDASFKKTKGFKGYALVTFEDQKGLNKALNFKEHVVSERKVHCSMALTKKDAKKAIVERSKRKLYIGGIDKETTEETLMVYFSKFGKVN